MWGRRLRAPPPHAAGAETATAGATTYSLCLTASRCRIRRMGRSRPTHVADPRALGARIKQVRSERGLSLRDVAFAGCSASFLSRVEAGLRVPSTPVLIELAGRLGVRPEQLLGRRIDGRVAESS